MPEELTAITEYRNQFTRNFFPENELFARALAQVIVDYEWDSFTLIYENNNSLEQLQDVLQIHESTDKPVTVRQLGLTDDYKPLLKEIKVSGESRIVINCNPEKVLKLLQQAAEVKMLEEYQVIICLVFENQYRLLSGIRATLLPRWTPTFWI